MQPPVYVCFQVKDLFRSLNVQFEFLELDTHGETCYKSQLCTSLLFIQLHSRIHVSLSLSIFLL